MQHLKPIHDMNSSAHQSTKLNPAITTNSPAPSPTSLADVSSRGASPRAQRRFKLGLDVDLNWVVTAIQCEHGAIKPAQKLSRAQLLSWVRQQVAAGHAVHTVYEACGFGYTLHEELTAAGAHSLVTTPTRLSPERRRKNDRLDARELCVRLAAR